MAKVPNRIAWAVELLDIQPDDQILEFGFGPGVSVELMASRLSGGQVVAIERSATAISRARQRLVSPLADGRVALEQTDLAGFDGAAGQFDKALGVNINVFWTGTADAELAVLARVLRPGGRLLLIYEGPPGGSVRDVGPTIIANLSRDGFTAEIVPPPAPNLLGISATR